MAEEPHMSSPAFCGGLIEAQIPHGGPCGALVSLPPRSAGASLKRHRRQRTDAGRRQSSPAFCGGLIEASYRWKAGPRRGPVFPRVLRGPH